MSAFGGTIVLLDAEEVLHDPAVSESGVESDARQALDALPGLRWRPFDRDILPELAAFYTACESFDDNPERTSLADLHEFFDSVGGVSRSVAPCWAGSLPTAAAGTPRVDSPATDRW
ncbi:MAG: hypothetical protein ABI181_10020 [Mycobacteriaceae bacterium]